MPNAPSNPDPSLGSIDWQRAGAEALAHLKELIRIDTTNPPGNEAPAAEYIARALAAEGIEYEIVESAPSRASVVGRVRGNGKKRPLLLNGHLDVVPAMASEWRHPPFSAQEADGCIWGRGAIDMKNMVAMSLTTLVHLKRSGATLDRDVILAAVADEEAGSFFGASHLVEHRPDLVTAEYVLNEVGGYTLYYGNGVFYPIEVAEKGVCWFELTAEGTSGHGSMPKADNPVVRVGRAIEALGRVRLEQHNIPVVEAFLRRLAESSAFPEKHALPLLLAPRLAGTLLSVLEKKDASTASAMHAMLRNTASPTILSGGNKINVIPSSASVQVDGRIIPGQTVRAFIDEVQRVVGSDVKLNVLASWEGSEFDSKTELYAHLCRVVERHHPGSVPVPFLIPGFTDSHAYKQLGATCYGFSPVRLPAGMSFPDLYHGKNERIPVDGFLWGLHVLYDAVSEFCVAHG
jgi:acetylornithine deacetylase/succinyl-diaminopimelate desuccinylase-like protein